MSENKMEKERAEEKYVVSNQILLVFTHLPPSTDTLGAVQQECTGRFLCSTTASVRDCRDLKPWHGAQEHVGSGKARSEPPPTQRCSFNTGGSKREGAQAVPGPAPEPLRSPCRCPVPVPVPVPIPSDMGSCRLPAALLAAALASLLPPPAAPSAPRKLLVFLLDGFRFDYIDDSELEELPGFRDIVNMGVKVDYMTPDFPSLSYPNYYTLMTGRHCEVHQMIGNYMWDQKANVSFDIGVNKESLLPLWWNGSEPLWVTMMKEKKNVSMYYWPGCEVEILGVRPSYCREYFSVPTDKNFADAISDALESLRNGSAEMAAVYYERIDVEGHHYGPSSQQRKNALKEVDKALSNMITLIKSKGLQHDVNVLLFSDHGMTDISWVDKVIELKNYINMSDTIQMKDRGPVVSLWPAPEKHAEIYQKLKGVEHMSVYNVQDIPDRFFYKKGKFVSPLTLVAEKGWFIVESRDKLPFWENGTGRKEAWQNGWHGYDNELMDMRGFFLAYGPDFRSNFRAPPIRSVDVYNIMCSLAGIQPLPNNGSWSRVECMLRNTAPLAPLAPRSSCALLPALLSLLAVRISLL